MDNAKVLRSSGFKFFVLSGVALGALGGFLAMFCSCDSNQHSYKAAVSSGSQPFCSG